MIDVPVVDDDVRVARINGLSASAAQPGLPKGHLTPRPPRSAP